MLHEFLKQHRAEVLNLCEKKSRQLAGHRVGSEQLKAGLPLFYDQLIRVLVQKLNSNPPEQLLADAAEHGKEFLRLGFSMSHVVHSYGAMCQAITELATIKNANISAMEFSIFNGCLDVAISAAVSEYQFRSVEASEAREVQHLGFLAHELRNALSSATIAQEMIKQGIVGTGGSTSSVLDANLARMRHLIDRSLSEVRMRAEADLYIEKFRLAELFDQVVTTAAIDATKRNQTITTEIDWEIELETDRQFILTAVANLIQNAIKYTHRDGNILLRGSIVKERILIEVQDQCGGIKPEVLENIFSPFRQTNEDRSGLGLGLTITRRAVELCEGLISVKNDSTVGCTFSVELPLKLEPPPNTKANVPGIQSVQPQFSRRL